MKYRRRLNTLSHSKLISGIIKKHPDGYGFLIPHQKNQKDVYLSKEELAGIFTDDELQVSAQQKGGRFYGKIKKIIQRNRTRVVGPLSVISKELGCVKDHENFFGADILFPLDPADPQVKNGEWVEVQITSYPSSKKGFQGKLSGRMGSFPKALSDNMKVLREHNISYLFSKNSLNEAQMRVKEFQKQSFKDRKDLSALAFATIDSQTAKDFDDAVYVKKKDKGWILFVSIADVSFFVKEGGALDDEAFSRGNSTYFPGFTAPMLPDVLSQRFCSLNPNEDRLTFTGEMHINKDGEVEKYLFYESMIQSQARLSYGEAQQIIDQGHSEKTLQNVQQSIKNAWELAQTLMGKRFQRGSLNLEIPETEVRLNAAGEPLDIIQSKRLDSHKLIEELMLVCNQCAAQFLSRKNTPSIYRVHSQPAVEDIDRLKTFFKSINLNKKKPSSLPRHPAQKFFDPQTALKKAGSLQIQLSSWIQQMKNHPKQLILHHLILRALPQACYSANNQGHFGLSFSHYTHFTSPIRRYSDLIIHRLLKKALGISNSGGKVHEKELEKKAQALSQMEQKSVQAERQIKDIKKTRFINLFIGKEFKAMITSIVKKGFFVTLQKYNVDGLVSLDSLGGRWVFDPVYLFLRSKPSGYLFQPGDEVLVQVISADIDQGKIDFKLLQHNNKPFNPFQKQKRARSRKRKAKKKLRRY